MKSAHFSSYRAQCAVCYAPICRYLNTYQIFTINQQALSEGLGNSKLVLCKAPKAFKHDILIPLKSFHNVNWSDELETLKAKLTFAPSVKILIVVKQCKVTFILFAIQQYYTLLASVCLHYTFPSLAGFRFTHHVRIKTKLLEKVVDLLM